MSPGNGEYWLPVWLPGLHGPASVRIIEHGVGPGVKQGERRFYTDNYTPPNWYESQSRLDLYASLPVLDANEIANKAHEKVLDLTRQMADLREAVEATDPTDRETRTLLGVGHSTLFNQMKEAMREAAVADNHVIELMRAGVHARPSQYLLH